MTEKVLHISSMDASELLKCFNSLKSEIEELKQAVKPEKAMTILTPQEVATWLNVSAPTLNNWVQKGVLKRYKLGNRAYYKKEEIINCLDGTKYADLL